MGEVPEPVNEHHDLLRAHLCQIPPRMPRERPGTFDLEPPRRLLSERRDLERFDPPGRPSGEDRRKGPSL